MGGQAAPSAPVVSNETLQQVDLLQLRKPTLGARLGVLAEKRADGRSESLGDAVRHLHARNPDHGLDLTNIRRSYAHRLGQTGLGHSLHLSENLDVLADRVHQGRSFTQTVLTAKLLRLLRISPVPSFLKEKILNPAE
jgi:hypothetical protein